MSKSNEEFWYLLKFYYKKAKNASLTVKRTMTFMNGSKAVSVGVAPSWFKRFHSGNIDIKDAACSARPHKSMLFLKSGARLAY